MWLRWAPQEGRFMSQDIVVGIDLGTTNSEVAAYVDGRVRVLGPVGGKMLPSCVGLTPAGELLIGAAARNQQLLYPERTVRSVKRKMGSGETVVLGDRSFSPPEISALILRELAQWAARDLGTLPRQAVITVPAYFSDVQRQATREAGALAGLEVVRILNEPTAASLAYGELAGHGRTAMVYDLGGGTFDVSVVRLEGEVTEVLASHGNNRLGGDDFTDQLARRLEEAFQSQTGVDIRQDPAHAVARSRVWWAAEAAKMKLSAEPFAMVREENLLLVDGRPLHLDLELSRDEYERLIRPLAESTLESVSKALHDAGTKSGDLDAILLVGGSTRTPLVCRLLKEASGLTPRQDVHPDLCVALGAGVLASRLGGHAIERVLVDVSPYSFGVSYLGVRGGVPYPHCYHPIIERNTPLPVTRTEQYFTAHAYQQDVDLEVFQGDDDDALKNVLVGNFRFEGLTEQEEPLTVLCRMNLDIDGILKVTAIEKATGKNTHIVIDNAFKTMTREEVAEARRRLEALYASRPESAADADLDGDEDGDEDEDEDEIEEGSALEFDTTIFRERDAVATAAAAGHESAPVSPAADEADSAEWRRAVAAAERLVARATEKRAVMHADDGVEAEALSARIAAATQEHHLEELRQAAAELGELLFFVEGM
jgi:molecular chaperone DnaK (HSP70)